VATSCSALVRNGIKTIANADTTLRTLTGKTSLILLPWETALAAVKPAGAIMVSANNRAWGLGDRRRVQVLIGWFAEGNGAQTKVDALVQRTREMLTPAAFQALSPALDAFVRWGDSGDRDGIDEADATTPTNIVSAQLDLVVELSAPQV
jgi:hypothetical protein